MRLVAISDTHNLLSQMTIPDGDVLIHCGDITREGTLEELQEAARVLRSLPHRHKIVIAGNHDLYLEDNPQAAADIFPEAVYLCDSGVTIGGIKFWGAPWQAGVGMNYGAFMLPPLCAELSEHWSRIPPDATVLVTHTPPAGILDGHSGGGHAGCDVLRRYLAYSINPRVHLFGHVHSRHGRFHDPDSGTLFVNAAIEGSHGRPHNQPQVIDL